jgi:diketogulonate reductase-like aldo/keto reductase
MGYRHIDTASAYGNHKAIGRALKNFDRSKLFITSKLWLEKGVSVEKECNLALKELDTDYLDLYLIHQPYGDIYGSWRALQELYTNPPDRTRGVARAHRAFSVSNVLDAYEVLLDKAASARGR